MCLVRGKGGIIILVRNDRTIFILVLRIMMSIKNILLFKELFCVVYISRRNGIIALKNSVYEQIPYNKFLEMTSLLINKDVFVKY